MPATTCEHDDTLLTRAALRLLSANERVELAERLETCGVCRARLAEYHGLVFGLQHLVPVEQQGSLPTGAEAGGNTAPVVVRGRWRHDIEAGADGHDEDDGDGARRAVLPSPTHGRRAITLVGTLAALLLLALLLSSFWTFGPGRGLTGTLTQAVGTHPGLPVVDRVLGAAPLACAGAPTPQHNASGINGTIGQAPFLVGGFVGTHAMLLADGTTPSPYGWYGKIVTQVDSGFAGTLTLRGVNLRNNTPLWFQLGNATTTTPVFRHSAGASDAGYVFIPTAGCYTLTVNWGTGSWTYTFGAGSAPPA